MKVGSTTPQSNTHYKTAYLDWKESCGTDLGVRFREAYPCDLTDCYGGSVGKIIRELSKIFRLFRTTGWPFRRALKRYNSAIRCIQRVTLAYSIRSRALEAAYMEWWTNAEEKFRRDDEQRRLQKKLPAAGTPAAEKYKKLYENVSLNLSQEIRHKALTIHLRNLKFAFMKKYSAWLKQYKSMVAEMRRKRREAMLTRHSKLAQDNPEMEAKIDQRLREYRRSFIKHIMSRPCIQLNPKTEKLETLYEAADVVQAEKIKEREQELFKQFMEEKMSIVKGSSSSSDFKQGGGGGGGGGGVTSSSPTASKSNRPPPLSSQALTDEGSSHHHHHADALSPLVPTLQSPKFASPIGTSPQSRGSGFGASSNTKNAATTTPVALVGKLTSDNNDNLISVIEPAELDETVNPFSSQQKQQQQQPKPYQDQIIDIYAPPDHLRRDRLLTEPSLKALKVDQTELARALGKKTQYYYNNNLRGGGYDRDDDDDDDARQYVPPQRVRSLLPITLPGPKPAGHDVANDPRGPYVSGAKSPAVTSSAREAFLGKIAGQKSPTCHSPFQQVTRSTFASNNNKNSTTSGDVGSSSSSSKNKKAKQDVEYEENLSRMYFPQKVPFRILDRQGVSETDLACRRVQRDAERRVAELARKCGPQLNRYGHCEEDPPAPSKNAVMTQRAREDRLNKLLFGPGARGRDKGTASLDVREDEGALGREEARAMKDYLVGLQQQQQQQRTSGGGFKRQDFPSLSSTHLHAPVDQSPSANRSAVTKSMLTNAVHTGSSWMASRVISTPPPSSSTSASSPSRDLTQHHHSSLTPTPARGAIQPGQPSIPSTKAWSRHLSPMGVSASAEEEETALRQQQRAAANAPSLGAGAGGGTNSESIFAYLYRTGVPAPTVETMRSASRERARNLRPLFAGKIHEAIEQQQHHGRQGSVSPWRLNRDASNAAADDTATTRATMAVVANNHNNHNSVATMAAAMKMGTGASSSPSPSPSSFSPSRALAAGRGGGGGISSPSSLHHHSPPGGGGAAGAAANVFPSSSMYQQRHQQHQQQYQASRNPKEMLAMVETALMLAPPPMRREFDVSSMARTTAPYVSSSSTASPGRR